MTFHLPLVVRSGGASRSRQDGEGRQWYLGKAAETREPVTERPHGCLSGPGGRRQWGPQGGRWSLSARSRAASSGRAPAAPAHHKHQCGLVRVRLRLQRGWSGQGVSLPDPFPCTRNGGKEAAGAPGGPPFFSPSLPMIRAMGSFFPSVPCHPGSAGKC